MAPGLKQPGQLNCPPRTETAKHVWADAGQLIPASTVMSVAESTIRDSRMITPLPSLVVVLRGLDRAFQQHVSGDLSLLS